MFLIVYAMADLARAGQCDFEGRTGRNESHQISSTLTDCGESRSCCDGCFCCGILILPRHTILLDKLRNTGDAPSGSPLQLITLWDPLVYHPPKSF